ncbi:MULTISPECIES: decarboxylating cobalt-precorrin-6B (C(15))-methyltransferase [unclassified Granulicatella]|uniref:decarboxylating cobalt-precorrin-6B (C(15))-methyltransferase n=1 Tax=unclassified Granulicatella TaxID=2630493 RepID=UPI00107408CD|nr:MULTISPECIES: decarboxylating cobalt-precorrin-6B (C(15))-methyltransferase [unclassified Granulicatella]MBF0779515.1 decarboxylating cobalt-precorrin-6B (C(15))-methyltransferase [Granulicatella sp. 19428wC4_WM01]TFU96481.1 decarboxylating cobalt-precorrin-6B (C(15))-methyltransferase [Granulicatella sp. WM01]
MKDNEFIRVEKVPMTKEEVRAISLDKLGLHQAKNMLDVGSGTGSVSLQAAITYPNLKITAIERSEDAVGAMQQNIEHFNLSNIELIKGYAPIELNETFDAIFVGGTGGNLEDIVNWCDEHLLPGGRMVFNFILLENALEAAPLLENLGWGELDMITVQAGRWTKLGKGHYFKPQNPTIIITCEKPL